MERIGNIPAAIVRNIADIFAIDVRYFLYGEKYCDLRNETKPEETESKKDEQQLVLSRKEQEVIRLLRLFEKEEREEVHNLIGKIYNLKREKKSSK